MNDIKRYVYNINMRDIQQTLFNFKLILNVSEILCTRDIEHVLKEHKSLIISEPSNFWSVKTEAQFASDMAS